MKLKAGSGYWRLNNFPIGGDFHRAKIDTEIISIERDYLRTGCNLTQTRGCTHKVILSNGDTAAIDWSMVTEK